MTPAAEWCNMQKELLMNLYLTFNVRAGAAICNLNVWGCRKQYVILHTSFCYYIKVLWSQTHWFETLFSVYSIIILIVIYLKSSKKIALKRWTYGQVQKFNPDYFYLFAQNSYSLLFVVYIAKHMVKC